MVRMGVEDSARKEPAIRFQRCVSPYSGLGVVVLLAALPMTLSLVREAAFPHAEQVADDARQNAAASPHTLGNQPSKPALTIDAIAMREAKGNLLAFCSENPGARLGARLNCSPLTFTIQR